MGEHLDAREFSLMARARILRRVGSLEAFVSLVGTPDFQFYMMAAFDPQS